MELTLEQFNLRKTLEDSIDLIAPLAADKGLELAYSLDQGVPEVVIGDMQRVRQVLMNLLSNAGEAVCCLSMPFRPSPSSSCF